MKRILVPCDFSEPSMEAFKFALDLASKSNAEVIVMHTIHIPGGAHLTYDPLLLTEIEKDTEKEFEKMKKFSSASHVKIDFEMIYDNIVLAVQRISEKKKIDLIVMGTTGITRLQEVTIGSNTERVVRNASVPVIALHEAMDVASIKNILLPTTLSLKQAKFMNKVKELQEFFGAKLNVLLVNTPSHFRGDDEAAAALEEFVKHYKLQNYTLHFRNYRNEDEGILSFTHHEKMDLIAMGTHARKGLAHLFTRSITEGVISHISCPIWTFTIA